MRQVRLKFGRHIGAPLGPPVNTRLFSPSAVTYRRGQRDGDRHPELLRNVVSRHDPQLVDHDVRARGGDRPDAALRRF